jgi:hypothetical protein
LGRGLRKFPLIFGGVGHGHARAVDHFDSPAAPELGPAERSLQSCGNAMVEGVEFPPIESLARFAVGSGVGIRERQLVLGAPPLDLAHGFPAGATRAKGLRQERPKGHRHGEIPSPMSGFGRQFGGGNPRLKERRELT